MNQVVIISVEGFLTEGTDLRNSPPIQSSRILFDTLKATYQVVFLSTEPDQVLVRSWLKKEHFLKYATVFCRPASSILTPVDWKMAQVRELQADGWSIAYFMDTDPQAVEAAFLEGLPSLLMASPHYARPEWRPDTTHAVRPWDTLVSTLEKENLLRVQEVS